MSDTYILDGHVAVPCDDLLAWGKWLGSANRVVKKEKVGNVEVSTVFLGLDHSFGGGVPILFETITFGDSNDRMRRCSTWEQAEAQHASVCAEVQSELDAAVAPPVILKELEGYDWEEVFGEGGGGNCTAIVPQIAPGDRVAGETFSRADVALIRGQVEGERDEASWIVWGQLKDGRWFFAEGSCDYTGWDCQASNGGAVASTEDVLIRFGMGDEDRSRFGIVLAEQS